MIARPWSTKIDIGKPTDPVQLFNSIIMKRHNTDGVV